MSEQQAIRCNMCDGTIYNDGRGDLRCNRCDRVHQLLTDEQLSARLQPLRDELLKWKAAHEEAVAALRTTEERHGKRMANLYAALTEATP